MGQDQVSILKKGNNSSLIGGIAQHANITQNYPAVQVKSDNNVQADHKDGIRQMGAASTVLLKNEANILPIDPAKVKKIAVIGSDAGKNPM